MNITVPVSPGELLDKIVILEIKSERITDPAKLANVTMMLAALKHTWDAHVPPIEPIAALTVTLKGVNTALWDIEDEIRLHERRRDFGEGFVQLARSVYLRNDERARIKRQVDELFGSHLVEEKSYEDYGTPQH